MALSTWISWLNFLVLIFIIAATGFSFVAYANITTPTNATSVTAANNESANQLLLWSGILGIIIFLMLFLYLFVIIFFSPVVDITDPMNVANAGPNFWTFFLYFMLIAGLIGMVFLTGYALNILDSTVTGNQTARNWAIAAIVLALLAFVFEFIIFFLSIWDYYEVSKLKTIDVVTPISRPSELSNVFYFNRNPNTKGKFVGTISLTGELKEGNQFIEYNGQLIENTKRPQAIPIDVSFPINEGQVAQIQPRVIQPVVPLQPVPVVQPVIQPAAQRVVQPAVQPVQAVQPRVPNRRQVQFI